jgi:hypothetical protein
VVAGGNEPGRVLWSAAVTDSEYAPPAFGEGQIVVGDTAGSITAFGVGNPPVPRRFPPDP